MPSVQNQVKFKVQTLRYEYEVIMFTLTRLSKQRDSLEETIKKFYSTHDPEKLRGLAICVNDIAFDITFDAMPVYHNPPRDLFRAISELYKEAALLIVTLVEGEEKILALSMRERAELFERIASGEDVHTVFQDIDRKKEQSERCLV